MKRSGWMPIVVVSLCACGGASPAPASSPATAVAPSASGTASAVVVPAAVRAAVDAPDRSADDRALDAGRHPAETLAYFGIAPGMKVAELGAGTGYTTELLARTVGAGGTVFAQNNRFVLEKFAEKPWSARLAEPVMKNVVRVDREFDDPLPPEAHDLDAVVMILFYHDTFWLGADQAKMNAAVFRALKHGGVYGIVDHRAADGAGATAAQTLHRIDEKLVVQQVKAAGFVLDGEADFLRNAADAHDWNASPRAAGVRRGTSDRFVLRFKKP